MIKSFAEDEARIIFQRNFSKKLPSEIQRVALRKLKMLNSAHEIKDLRVPPANRLEKLSGNRAGQYSVRINGQWRLCFTWRNGNAYDVEIVDYH